jgi:hypothetical protein
MVYNQKLAVALAGDACAEDWICSGLGRLAARRISACSRSVARRTIHEDVAQSVEQRTFNP